MSPWNLSHVFTMDFFDVFTMDFSMKNLARSRGLSRVAEVRQAEGPSSHSPPRGPKNLGKPWEKHGESGCMWLLCVFFSPKMWDMPHILMKYMWNMSVFFWRLYGDMARSRSGITQSWVKSGQNPMVIPKVWSETRNSVVGVIGSDDCGLWNV